ncbi:MAG TPA: DUF1611 domain-containing protein [Spirochaetia bacterium]|nr:DUF1611 domain-containing protein [Spirochaetia bacterium]
MKNTTHFAGAPEGNAIVFCEGAFALTYGKTAHGLVRFTRRYNVLSVIDSTCAGRDAAELLDGTPKGIPILADLTAAVTEARGRGSPATHMVVGVATDGGVLDNAARNAVAQAVGLGLNVDSGLHQFVADIPDIAALAAEKGVVLRDIRKTGSRDRLHAFTGRIEDVTSTRIAVLGTDSAIGKRTTAWILVDALGRAGHRAELIGTGQTAWLQGARYSIVLDSLINDFVAGELENVVWTAWKETGARALVVEGQGSLLNPAYPGGFEILAATRPHAVILQHAPFRREYDGFPGYPLDPLSRQIEAIQLVSRKPVVAITINHEGIDRGRIEETVAQITRETGLPACDPIWQSAEPVVRALAPYLA